MRIQALTLLALVAPAFAHGTFKHDDLETQLLKRDFYTIGRRSLESCAGSLNSDGTNKRAHRRRAAVVNHHRRALLQKRSMVEVLNTSHLYTGDDIDPDHPASAFTHEHHVLLTPYGDTGPYYVPGELIRDDAREDQEGIPIIVEAQFIDFITCKPIPGMWWDMWNANATGVYSGVINEGNGDFTDHSNVNNTFLRAVQLADEDGVAQIKTIFPGHYTGRTNHIHIIAHTDVTVLKNGTITGGSIAHTGQFFFDQDLIDKVSQTYPYTQNPYQVTGNKLDDTFHQETAYSASDPVFHYEYLGDSIEDGLFLWVRIGVNASANWDNGVGEHSFTYGANGGKYSCGTGRIGANYTTADEDCTGSTNVGDLPGENGPGPAVYSAPPPSAWDNETDEAERSAAKSWLAVANGLAAATETPTP
ncbi:intradioldioxygenaselike [Aspergillus parasiticus SU-1]|uniref:Intradioldioxygenaselike n=1 Tax=Aspergillus parasiticus (strain ATCC 56775 / NRRL 5862 / SRRC 143 / SU-1) TaxID=1403190 RepID=A0A0F0I7K2_ASPPU|nr:intradioldioxygenaselike [Aspergillus parasiticus SU-1]